MLLLIYKIKLVGFTQSFKEVPVIESYLPKHIRTTLVIPSWWVSVSAASQRTLLPVCLPAHLSVSAYSLAF